MGSDYKVVDEEIDGRDTVEIEILDRGKQDGLRTIEIDKDEFEEAGYKGLNIRVMGAVPR